MEGHSFLSIIEGIKEPIESINYDVADINIVGGEPTMLLYTRQIRQSIR